MFSFWRKARMPVTVILPRLFVSNTEEYNVALDKLKGVGGTIHLAAGIYDSHQPIPSNVELRGAGNV